MEYEYGYQNGRQLDHYLVDVTAAGRDNLERVLAIAFTSIVSGGVQATHLAEAGRALVFFDWPPRHLDRDWSVRVLDPPFGCDEAVEMVWQWLKRADYGRNEHDGVIERGFHVYNGQFGIVDEVWETFVAVEPTYIYIPK